MRQQKRAVVTRKSNLKDSIKMPKASASLLSAHVTEVVWKLDAVGWWKVIRALVIL